MKRIFAAVLVLMLAVLISVPVLAESTTMDGWSVRFTEGQEMVQDFGESNDKRTTNSLNHALDDELKGMQPGDDITFVLTLKNENKDTTRWYMTNEVLDSLEDNSANSATHGGAYTYRLVFNGPGGETVLFDSETVGGDAQVTRREGLNEATASLEDFFYLDTLKQGESGTVTLHVALDGETQGNDYQDTLADLKMNFAVELESSGTPNNPGTVVKTGDEYKLVPYYIAMGVSGILFLVLAVDSIRRRKEDAA